jgi:hypothetical protein
MTTCTFQITLLTREKGSCGFRASAGPYISEASRCCPLSLSAREISDYSIDYYFSNNNHALAC